MSVRKRLGISQDVCYSPFLNTLANEPTFECIVDLVANNAIRMREHELDGAFLTPIDYARESSDYSIIPYVAVSSRVATDTIVLCFKEGLHTVNTLAVHPTSTSEIVLASILLGERFDVRPKILPVIGNFDEAMRRADATLLVGDEAVKEATQHRNKLDLVEEWNDMTDLPYVHGFWCVREEVVSRGDVAAIQRACKRGSESIDEIVDAAIAGGSPHLPPDLLRQYLKSFSFTLNEEEQEAVAEFLRYAYYRGVVPDVADLHFFSAEDETLPADPSLN
jgi:chorismate dehydratase